MREVDISFSLECDCRQPVAATHSVPQVVKNMAQTDFYECKSCQTRYFVHIQECKRDK